MKFISNLSRSISALIRGMATNIVDLSDWLGRLIRVPIKDLSSAFSKGNVETEKKEPLGKKLLLLPLSICLALLSGLLRILISPLDLVAGLIQGRPKKHLQASIGIVALIAIVFGVYLYAQNNRPEVRMAKLRRQASASFQKQEFATAAGQYDELMAYDSADDNEKLNWAIAHSRSGNSTKSAEILSELAPGVGGSPGYAVAHQVIAAVSYTHLTLPTKA